MGRRFAFDLHLGPYPSVQNVVTGARAIGTVYQNTTGRPMFVGITASSNTLGAGINGYADSNSAPTTLVAQIAEPIAGGYQVYLCFWVLPGNYYKLTVGGAAPTLYVWTEWY